MKTKSAKAKGRKLQDWTRERLIHYFGFNKEQEDISCAIMGEKGEDIKILSKLAKEQFPYSIECKNSEAHNVWKEYAQASEHGKEPIVIIKKNKHKPLAVIDANTLIKLIACCDGGIAWSNWEPRLDPRSKE
jgi:hypothetical protein